MDLEVIELFRRCRAENKTKYEFLKEAAQIEGVYVPALYDVEYNDDGTVKRYIPKDGAPAAVKKRVVNDVDNMYFPETFVVPFLDIVHDRAVVEVLRGCIRGCRFCQAGGDDQPAGEKPVRDDRLRRDLALLAQHERLRLSL